MEIPLWQILAKASQQPARPLTCEECLVVLEYLADRLLEGAEMDNVRAAARRHLAQCPGCRETRLHRLDVLEQQYEET